MLSNKQSGFILQVIIIPIVSLAASAGLSLLASIWDKSLTITVFMITHGIIPVIILGSIISGISENKDVKKSLKTALMFIPPVFLYWTFIYWRKIAEEVKMLNSGKTKDTLLKWIMPVSLSLKPAGYILYYTGAYMYVKTDMAILFFTGLITMGCGVILYFAGISMIYSLSLKVRKGIGEVPAELVCIAGQYAGASFPLNDKGVAVGRDPGLCDLVLGDSQSEVSRFHCRVYYDNASGKVMLVDSSTNGTFNNEGQKLVKGEPYSLKSGSSFFIGKRKEVFRVSYK